jgi:hypothetical protein
VHRDQGAQAYALGEEWSGMSAKKAPPPGRQAKLARRVKRLERRIRSTERKEARQARLVERIRTRRATLDGRLAMLRTTLESASELAPRKAEFEAPSQTPSGPDAGDRSSPQVPLG